MRRSFDWLAIRMFGYRAWYNPRQFTGVPGCKVVCTYDYLQQGYLSSLAQRGITF